MKEGRVYASTAGIARHFRTLPDLLSALTGAGIRRVELGWAPAANGLSLPGDLARYPARWLVHNYFPAPAVPFVLNLASQDAGNLRRSREFAAAAIRLSAALGAPFYSVHCGFLAEFDPGSLGAQLAYSDVNSYEPAYQTYVESLRFLLPGAKGAGIRLLVEPNVVAPANLVEGRNRLLMLAEPAEFQRLFSDVDDGRLGVLLDLGHLKVSSRTLGFSEAEFVETVAAAVGCFHLHDNDGRVDQHRPVVAGSWALEVLRQRRFQDIPVVVEAKFDGVPAMAEHCMWLENLLR